MAPGVTVVARTEFIRTLQLEPWPPGGRGFDVAADAEEREALRRRLDLEGLDRLAARGRVIRSSDDAFLLQGTLDATVVQTCVVSLEPVVGEIEQPFEILLRRAEEGESDEALDPDAPDAVAVLGDELELGELLVEELALALDPYPQAPGAREQLPSLGPDVALDAPEESNRPFAALGALTQTRARPR